MEQKGSETKNWKGMAGMLDKGGCALKGRGRGWLWLTFERWRYQEEEWDVITGKAWNKDEM